MSSRPPLAALPKRLQSMIVECQQVIANWQSEEGGDDPMDQSMKDWALRISRGEFDDCQYWQSVAEEHEENGDWASATNAYAEILKSPTTSEFDRGRAHSWIGQIQGLWGDNGAALNSYSLASQLAKQGSIVMWRCYIVCEIRCLQRMGEIDGAFELTKLALAEPIYDLVDHLGIARLIIAGAECEIANQNLHSAGEALQGAWQWLDAMVSSFGEDEARDAKGVQATYANWWCAEADRCRLARDVQSEISALGQAREKAELCFFPDGWQGPWDDLRMMKIMLRTAEAYERGARPDEARAARDEADTIFVRRKFPESVRNRSSHS
jgi:hypothetical protein